MLLFKYAKLPASLDDLKECCCGTEKQSVPAPLNLILRGGWIISGGSEITATTI